MRVPFSLFLLISLVAPVCGFAPAAAQAPGHSPGDWKRVETEHFLFLYPEELAGWVLPMAERMEAVRSDVQALVGYAPEDQVTVLVDDPSNVSNGSVSPGPIVYLWPTPPDPRSMIGENRGWGELLAVHEFAHVAHLTRPSRNPLQQLWTALLPIPIPRIMRKTPRWAAEGYATYVEGQLTGSGRPHGVWRPALLRTWALEGQLPSYDQISSPGGFYGGSFAYLSGSAFLEWLVAREGGDESVLPDVWARLTARQTRDFDDAFTGVFGAPPHELYGHFTVDVMESALAVREAVESAGGVVDGALFQRLMWSTGDPAVSPDGERLALVLRSEDDSRLVVMSTTPDTLTTEERERREQIFEEDSLDVPPVEDRPRAQEAEATLWPEAGMAPYHSPRWMPDGSGILVVRNTFVENARRRPDLFLWDWEDGDVRRITHGEAIREADPAPDGSWAAGLRCLHARCDIVRIDLETGNATVIAAGDPQSPWFHPRVSPDGESIVASRQVDGRWRLVAMEADGSDARFIGPDDGGDRYGAEFLEDGSTLVLTSTASGIPQLELLDRPTGDTRPLTRVLGTAVAPAPAPEEEVFFLSLHSRGWDLRRIDLDSAATSTIRIDPASAPAAAVPPIAVDAFPPAPIGPVQPYNLTPRLRTILPMGVAAPEVSAVGAVLNSTDPIGMLSWQIRGMYGEEDAFRGGALDLVWRGLPPAIRLGGFMVGGPVPNAGGAVLPITADPFEEAYYGGLATLDFQRVRVGSSQQLLFGGSVGEVAGDTRTLGWADAEAVRRFGRGKLGIATALGLHGALGRTGAVEWKRWLASGSFSIGLDGSGLGVSGLFGRSDAPTGSGERFALGGTETLLLDPSMLSQRIAMPALPSDFMNGDEVWAARAGLLASGATIFYWTGDARGDVLDRYSLLGAEISADIPAVHYVRLPASHFRLGVARLLDDPMENEWRAWAMLGFTP